eukprot:1433490-Prymnesium_polylepis.1
MHATSDLAASLSALCCAAAWACWSLPVSCRLDSFHRTRSACTSALLAARRSRARNHWRTA